MGQIINFVRNDPRDSIKTEGDLLASVSKLSNFLDNYLVFCLTKENILDQSVLLYFTKQILLLNKLGIKFCIVCPVEKAPLDQTEGVLDKLEFECLNYGLAATAANAINEQGGLSIKVSAREINLAFGEIEKSIIDLASYESRSKKNAYGKTIRLNSHFLSEINKSSIIPIIIPISSNRMGKKILLDTNNFACHIASEFEDSRVIISDTLESVDIKKTLHSISQIESLLATGRDMKECKINLTDIIESMKKGIEYIHILDFSKKSIINDITFTSCSGLLIYNDAEHL